MKSSSNRMKGMKGVVIKDIKRKTTLPLSVMKKAVEYAYSIETTERSTVPIRIIPG